MNDKPIFIQPDQLRIVPFSEKHITSAYIGWLNNKEIVKYSEQRHANHTYESCYTYWRSFHATPNFFWAIEIFQKDKWFHIGNINAYVNPDNKLADIGILIGEQSVWGKGYGLMAWKAVCNYLLTQCHIRKVTGGTLSTNESMLKIMKRAGMVEDGKRTRHYICEKQEIDMCHYALFRNKDDL